MTRRNITRDALRRPAERLDALVRTVSVLQRELADTKAQLERVEVSVQRLRANNEATLCARLNAANARWQHAASAMSAVNASYAYSRDSAKKTPDPNSDSMRRAVLRLIYLSMATAGIGVLVVIALLMHWF